LPTNEAARRASAEAAAILPELPRGADVLLIRLRSLGDLVLETPAIRALHDWRPDLRISVLAEERFAAVFEGNPAVSAVIHPRGFVETARELRRRRFPVVFNQHGGPTSALLTGGSGAPSRVGWKGYQYSFLYNVKVPDAREFYAREAVHTAEHRISQLFYTGLPRRILPASELFPQADAARTVAGTLAEKGIEPGADYAVLQPGARTAGMRWPLSKFAAVARWLWKTQGIQSVVNLAARDEEMAAVAKREFEGLAVIPPAMGVRELIALTAGARLFVGNDSGPAHIASALDKPCVVIFSETDPEQWGPRNTHSKVVATGATFAHPRGDKAVIARQERPIAAIALGEVQEACEEVLRG
jgi:ADP-heptose:LPS heptosyltransferase